MKIFVTGATGTVGRHVVDKLLAQRAEVRALTRRPETAGLPSGVEVVAGDLENPEALADHFEGIDRLYLVVAGETQKVVELAKRAGVTRIVLLSSASAAFEGDPTGGFHRAAEVVVENSGIGWTHVRPGMFAGNLSDWAEAIRAEGVVRAPYDAARQAPVHEVDVAEVAAAALLAADEGKIYTVTGPESLTKSEQVRALGEGIGREVRFEELTPDQWRAHVKDQMPEFVADWLLGLWAKTVDNPEQVLPTVDEVAGRPARTLREWAADHRDEFR
ncbi:NAD(P)H-binding protein [Micromonospora rifamycinica]|uniref:NAD(P)H-binding protein n=1 Tax=Micromonospora rifamycinica TaxID=291594 RepID=UPI002E289715|nr:NAD(P)H-binding protein [Micromonospora rifamycinica]